MIQPPPERVWGFPMPRTLPPPTQDRVIAQLPELIEDWLSADRLRTWRAQDRFALLVRSIVGNLLVAAARDTAPSAATRLARAESAAAQSLHLGFDVNHMAQAAGYERSYFSALYRRTRGITAREYLARLRLGEAQRLLRETNLAIAEVARQVGYQEPVVFTRMFKRRTGSAPREWRNDDRRNRVESP